MNISNKISIIIPFYNAKNTIAKTIDSILSQNYRNFEIIAVNDGSNDDGEMVVKQYEDSRIRLINKKNGGVSSARNVGIENAEGDFITFIDADDYLSPNAFEKICDTFERTHVDAMYYLFLFENANSKEYEKNPFNKNALLDNKSIKKELIPLMIKAKNGEVDINGSVCRTVWKTDIIKDLRFDENIPLEEDLLFCIESFINLKSLFVLNEHLYHYIRNSSSATQHYKKTYLADNLSVNKKIKFDLIKYDCWNDEIKKRFSGKRLYMYTASITNLYKPGYNRKKERIKDLLEIDTIFSEDNDLHLFYDKHYVSIMRHVTYLLLKWKMIHILNHLYYIKEYFRQKTLN